MGARQFNDVNTEKAKVEISAGLLAKLITTGLLRGNECKCLDDNARNVLWQSLLSTSVNV